MEEWKVEKWKWEEGRRGTVDGRIEESKEREGWKGR